MKADHPGGEVEENDPVAGIRPKSWMSSKLEIDRWTRYLFEKEVRRIDGDACFVINRSWGSGGLVLAGERAHQAG